MENAFLTESHFLIDNDAGIKAAYRMLSSSLILYKNHNFFNKITIFVPPDIVFMRRVLLVQILNLLSALVC